ncbi:hypothetical protein H9655_18580 [Cytobacillus sp. Sa5YUA1]|uniref:Uncharacterized protein n=1 Tax=Cytobacillus stercorigallinarum TaxID=2762240 RepID=A0ABR8QU39_9BACI|nr:DUF6414 family protein [Cytobacillus stercorigallinarum]MBD7939048.1 hypothetical protein [Cytobacillus stercorigallinarum]
MKKIVYFDEESVTDYLQISNGGNLNKTTELLKETGKNAQIDGKAGVGTTKDNVFSNFLNALIGFSGNVEVNAAAGAKVKTDNIAKTIIQNTILTDFLDSLGNDNSAIEEFKDYILEAEKDSLTYIVMISPFMSMISGNPALDETGEYDLVIDKIDETIRNAKGYYEFIGIGSKTEHEEVVFRFNINAFKNNYNITDLRKMNLIIHAMHVGFAKKSDLTFNGEFELNNKKSNNPKFGERDSNREADEEVSLKVYDVLIAGVE